MPGIVGGGGPLPPGVTASQTIEADFIRPVAAATGLDELVVRSWAQIEGNLTSNNPLNIMAGGKPIKYASLKDGAAATIALLRTPTYASVLKTAAGTPEQQIAAIAASPWDKCQYRGTLPNGSCANAAPGAALADVYNGFKTGIGIGIHPLSWIGDLEQWAGGAALRSLLYLTFTALALGLVFLAVRRTESFQGIANGVDEARNFNPGLALGRAGSEAIPF